MTKTTSFLLALIFSIQLSLFSAFAGQLNNTRALHDVSTAKAYFDVSVGIAAKLQTLLKLIHDTHEQLIQAGIKPDFIIGFRSKASNFVTKGEDYVFEEEIAAKKEIIKWVERFKKIGIPMEQCGLSAQFEDIDPVDFISEVELVQNGYISMIGYQAQGYSMVPMN